MDREKVIREFVIEYLNDRKYQLENNFLIFLGEAQLGQLEIAWKNPLQTPLGQQLMEIARAAAGEMPDDQDGVNRGVVYEGIQSLVEQLFCPPGWWMGY